MVVEDGDGIPFLADTQGAADLLRQAGIVNALDRIHDWRRRDLLKPDRVVGRRPVYLMAHVWAVEKRTRTRRRRPRRLTMAG